jgi:hypothetical protein
LEERVCAAFKPFVEMVRLIIATNSSIKPTEKERKKDKECVCERERQRVRERER